MENSQLIEVKDVDKSYATLAEILPVLQNINFTLSKGDSLSVIGESGTGKSTLLNLIGGLDYVSSGNINVFGTAIEGLTETELAHFRNNHIGFVFQYHHLLPDFSALENAVIPALVRGDDKTYASLKARQLLEMTGLGSRLDHRPSQLSGGEQQRVAIVRALINNPGLLLLDEPTGNLDEKTGDSIMEMIWKLQKEQDLCVLLVTHNLALARQSSRCLRLVGGSYEFTDLS